MFTKIEDHLIAYGQKVEASVLEHAHAFVEWVKGEEAQVAKEVDDLKSKGFAILKDGKEL